MIRRLTNFSQRFPSFWVLQIVGWLLYGVLIYITFLTVVPPSGRIGLLQVKVSRTIAGFLLSSGMRLIYKRSESIRSVPFIAFLIILCSFLFGSLWPFGERLGLWVLTRPASGFTISWARYPVEVLDYSITLIGWSALYFGIKYWKEWQAERDRSLQAEALAHHAQLDMLRYQLNPHFLFNALNSIRASIDEDSRRAKRMVTEFSEFLRYSLLPNNSGTVPLRDEIDAIRSYLAIEKIRFEEKLEVIFEVEKEAEDFRVPIFLVHPLVENAIKHGMKNDAAPLVIRLTAQKTKSNGICIEVANSGRLNSASSNDSTGIGLKNVRERLARLYGDKGKLSLVENDEFVKASIEIN